MTSTYNVKCEIVESINKKEKEINRLKVPGFYSETNNDRESNSLRIVMSYFYYTGNQKVT